MDTKECTVCGVPKSLEDFNKDKNKPQGVQPSCRMCTKARYRGEADKYKTADKRDKARDRAFKKLLQKHSLTLDDFENMLADQDQVCKICQRPERVTRNGRVRRLCIDHDHKTGEVRALLCAKCNALLGQADDSVERLQDAITYLEQHG